MIQNLRLAFRSLVNTPGFTAVAIITVALAIGANTAVFSLVNALLIRPLPYKAPQDLVLIWEKFANQGLDRIPVSAPEYQDYEKNLKSYDRLAAFDYIDLNLTAGDVPERVQGAVVAPSVFPLLGIEPIAGRTFNESERGEGNDGVVMISARLWQRRFNSDPSLVGKQLSLNGRSFTVVGIMPAKFEFPLPLFNIQGGTFAQRVDIWKPIAFTKNELESRGSRSYGVIGRLKGGVSQAQAQAELTALHANWIRDFPNNYEAATGFGGTIYSLHEQVVGGMRTALGILLAAVALVLLIACANLTTMLLARAGSREREFAIRVALGASRWQLLRQVLTESVMLAVIGGAAGTFLALWGVELLQAIGSKTVPRIGEANLDLTVLIVTLGVSVVTGVLFGLVPALASGKAELTETLKEGGRGSTSGIRRNRIRNLLVIAEVALALVLLVSAGLLIKSFVRLQNVNPGFNPRGIVTMETSLPLAKYARGKPVSDFYAELLRRVQALPGIQHAAFTTILPLSGNNSDSSFHIEGRDDKATGVFPDEEIRVVTNDYFRVLETPLIKGRFFNDADTVDAPGVVIINQAMAKKYWPGEDAVGKRVNFDDSDPAKIKWTTVVGIVSDIRHRGLDAEPKPEYYLPHAQRAYRGMILAVRSPLEPTALVRSIRNEVRAMDAEQPIANISTLEAIAKDSIAPRRLSVLLIGVFAAVALVLAAVGIYGVMSFLVVQRTHEIGVRMALGAQRSDVLRLVIGRAAKLVLIGTASGLILGIVSSRALRAMLYNVGAFDLATFAGVTIALCIVSLLASYIPALRATRADPMVALGHGG
ncbi:MAG TPA: ABC transporter permease [Chthoniobacterales bacterium]|jgi:putative ABC transport system permease protein|nr:ABC transporter permease [Chthoniobacterales bacterium]